MMLDYLGPDVAQSLATLDHLPAAERPAWLPRLARPNYRYLLEAPAGSTRDDSSAGRRIGEALRQSIPSTQLLAVLQGGGRQADGTRVIQLRLRDGTPLTLELWPLQVGVSSTVAGIVMVQFMLFALAAWFSVRVATRPLRQLAEASDALDPDRPGAALDEGGPTEVSRAAQAFNAMRRRVQSYLAERARILAAISHDLQTPITRMRLRADLLEEGALREKLLSDLSQMQALVEQGIAYARSAHAATELPCRVDLGALLDNLVCDHVDVGNRVVLRGTTTLPFMTRPQTLRRLLGNLLDNSIKFAGGAEITWAPTPNGVEIAVSDRGPGIPEDQHLAVLRPFHRLEDSRNRSTGGSGLGLAIADQLAKALGGALKLSNRDGGGLVVLLSIPGEIA